MLPTLLGACRRLTGALNCMSGTSRCAQVPIRAKQFPLRASPRWSVLLVNRVGEHGPRDSEQLQEVSLYAFAHESLDWPELFGVLRAHHHLAEADVPGLPHVVLKVLGDARVWLSGLLPHGAGEFAHRHLPLAGRGQCSYGDLTTTSGRLLPSDLVVQVADEDAADRPSVYYD